MKGYFLIFIGLVIISCSRDSRPENLYEKSTMVSVLIQVHLAEARAKSLEMSPDSAMAYYLFQQREIFERFGIDSVDYRKSFEYYSKEIGIMDEIYEAVLDSLNYYQATKQN